MNDNKKHSEKTQLIAKNNFDPLIRLDDNMKSL